MLVSLNLSLSNRCTASCVWCPIDTRGARNPGDMPFETAKKVIDEVTSPGFPGHIQNLFVGENGEAFLNKDALNILRYIREKLPKAHVQMSNNFSLIKPELARIILAENLLDEMCMNIDGHDADSYKAVKGLSYKVVMRNLTTFLDIRKELKSKLKLTIGVVPLFEYVAVISTVFDKAPINLKSDIPCTTFQEVKAQLKTFAPDDVDIFRSPIGLWAERKYADPNDIFSKRTCPILHRVKDEIFIAPNGDWYPCCLDDNQDQAWGNVNQNTLKEIYESDKRIDFIHDLEQKKFAKIGYPCNTVMCCENIPVDHMDFSKVEAYQKGSKVIWLQEK